jgi:hypothetical protein
MEIRFVLSLICFVGILFCLFMFYRNEKVFLFSIDLLNKVSKRAKEQIDADITQDWRKFYIWYRSGMSSNKMFWQFWKPLTIESFYKEPMPEVIYNDEGEDGV